MENEEVLQTLKEERNTLYAINGVFIGLVTLCIVIAFLNMPFKGMRTYLSLKEEAPERTF